MDARQELFSKIFQMFWLIERIGIIDYGLFWVTLSAHLLSPWHWLTLDFALFINVL